MTRVGLDKFTLLLFITLIAGFCLRLAPALIQNNKITWEDESDYLNLAEKIANGEGFVNAQGTPTAFRPVGYPAFLALLRIVGIKSLAAIRITQALLGALIIWLVYRLGLAVFDRRIGLTGAVITAVYPYYIFMPGTILAETLFTALIITASLLLFLALKSGNGKLLLFSALIMGAAVLTRPAAWALVIGIMVWLVIYKPVPVKKRFGLAVLFFVTVTLLVTPWMTRNYRQLGVFSPATNGGRNFWLGNNPLATINSGSNIAMEYLMQNRIESAASEPEAEKIYYAEAMNYIKTHPRQFVILTIKKGVAFWRWSPSPVTGNSYTRETLMKWLSILSVGPVCILALVGLIMAPAEQRNKMLLWLIMAIFYTATHALYISKVRFRLPLDAFVILVAAVGLMWVVDKFWAAHARETV